MEITKLRKCRAHFGISPDVTSIPCMMIGTVVSPDTKRGLSTWSLLLLNKCWTENVNVSMCRCDEMTFWIKTWYMVDIISHLSVARCHRVPGNFPLYYFKIILFFRTSAFGCHSHRRFTDLLEKTLVNKTKHSWWFFCLLDGTDCRIQDRSPSSSRRLSRKFHAPRTRYKISLSIESTKIVWVHCPFPCGTWPYKNDLIAGSRQCYVWVKRFWRMVDSAPWLYDTK